MNSSRKRKADSNESASLTKVNKSYDSLMKQAASKKRHDCSMCAPLEFDPPLIHKYCLAFSRNVKPILKASGIKYRSGRFTKREKKMIIENFENFVERFKPEDPLRLLGFLGADRCSVSEYIMCTNFYYRLARGLNDRTIISIYMAAALIFAPYSHGGLFSPEEDELLLKLQKQMGNKWTKMAKFFNRSPLSICIRFAYLKPNINKGRWNADEDCNLESSMKEVLKVDELSELNADFTNLPWAKIQNGVPTRNSEQCQKHWLNCSSWCIKSEKSKLNNEDKLLLVRSIAETNAFEDCEVDFREIYLKHFFDKTPSFQALRCAWHKLKYKVPAYHLKSYEEILQHLESYFQARVAKQ